MKSKVHLTALVVLLLCTSLNAQFLNLDARPPVTINGALIQNPWSGGMNSPIFSEMDLNMDNKMDLITFDVNGNRLSAYLNIGSTGQSKYLYSPRYISKFPTMHDWVRTYDYDCDGDMDILTYGNGAITVYKNESSANNLKFTLETIQINTNYGNIQSNLYVNGVTIPAFIDADGDGDMDVFAFPVSGSWVEYHKNFSMDSTGSCSGFIFHVQMHYPSQNPAMWGHFYLSSLSNIAVLGVQRPGPIRSQVESNLRSSLHSGSSLLAMDYQCDGDIDLLNGDILGSNLLFLQNSGNPDSISYQDSLFPSYNTPVTMQNMPSPTYMDINNDGKKDLLVTPFSQVGEDYNNVWLYNNQGTTCTPTFNRTSTRFLNDQSIDVGTSARPVFYDVDADGLQDMLIANEQYYNTVNPSLSYSRIAYFRNTGTLNFPAFTLIDYDYSNCFSLGVLDLYPSFGDIDSDGDKDMLMGYADGGLIYYENTAGVGNPATFVFIQANYQNIDVGSNSAPQIIDVDKDGLMDLIIGERAGNLNYYRNTGTVSSPVFTFVTNFFGGINVTKPLSLDGHSNPILFNNNGSYELLVGSQSGYIYHYQNIDNNLAGTFTLSDSSYQDIFESLHATIAMADIDGDNKFDLLVGNEDGGVRLYTQRNRRIVVTPPPFQSPDKNYLNVEDQTSMTLNLYPSPITDELTIEINLYDEDNAVSLQIFDVLGSKVYLSDNIPGSFKVNLNQLKPGIYFARITYMNGNVVQKFIKQ